jgi:hypothetical protein
MPNVEIAAICDVDETVLNGRLRDIEKMGCNAPRSFPSTFSHYSPADFSDSVPHLLPNGWAGRDRILACIDTTVS